jgi:hypothetical protein
MLQRPAVLHPDGELADLLQGARSDAGFCVRTLL